MPKIKLKPNSPEYDDGKPSTKTLICDMPGCNCEATHRAPKHRALNEYYNFCLDHVREYNNAWDFFSGMAESEVQDHMINSAYGFRPTWRYDAYAKMEEDLRTKAWQSYNFTEEEPPKHNGPQMDGQSPEYEALAIMGLEPPITLEAIKTRYKELAKKYHPDLNKNDPKAEELLKKINMSYTVLKLAYAEFETLPNKN